MSLLWAIIVDSKLCVFVIQNYTLSKLEVNLPFLKFQEIQKYSFHELPIYRLVRYGSFLRLSALLWFAHP